MILSEKDGKDGKMIIQLMIQKQENTVHLQLTILIWIEWQNVYRVNDKNQDL